MKKRLDTLKFGDVVMLRTLFEENTKDYYNGHSVHDVLGTTFKDNYGRSGKMRPVLVVDIQGDDILYSVLTSKDGNKDDNIYQYTLTDNTMTPNYEGKTTHVECGSVRRQTVGELKSLVYYGSITDKDVEGVKDKLTKLAFTTEQGRDAHRYLRYNKHDIFKARLLETNFELTKHQDKHVFTRDNMTFTLHKSGIIHYHYETNLQEIKKQFGIDNDFLSNVKELRNDRQL